MAGVANTLPEPLAVAEMSAAELVWFGMEELRVEEGHSKLWN